ncbi:uncharacterized protein LOC123552288 [Mercenaria mercenaria]|uniref:uncharacterized protein LOC123552288 n=1 Tax=Mercenaria mercenaria TaxID=6596 RepID=UPI001E1DBD4A|nr:uncharacterized protein LOC123552288 [Mercenaria mercenaria]
MKSLVLLLCSVIGLSHCVLIEWTAKDYPNPQDDPEACGRYPDKPSYVCDPNGLISRKAADFLDHILLNLQNDTKCPCSTYSCEGRQHSKGYIMAIALVEKIYKPENVQDTVDGRKGLVNQFAFDLLRKRWNTWDTCDELIIIAFSKDDRILTTVSGKTPLRVLTDPITKAIQIELARFFRDDGGNVGQGLHYLTMNYRRVLDGYNYYPIMYSDVVPDSAANMIKVSIITSIITTVLLNIFC